MLRRGFYSVRFKGSCLNSARQAVQRYARRDVRPAQKALGHTRIETTAKHYVLDELEVGLTEGLY